MATNLANSKTIVITRPRGDEAALRHELLELGHHVIHEPLTEIFLRHTARAEVEHALMADPDAIIITSNHGVQALALLTELRDVFLLCIGEATSFAATELGFTRVTMAGGNIDRMIDYIMSCYDEDARFLYISGEHIRVDLGQALSVHGMQVERVVAYDATACESLSDTLVEQLRRRQIDAFTFFSPRAAQIFINLAGKAGVIDALSRIDAFCLSEAIAETAKTVNWQGVYTADEATLASLIASVDNAYKNKESHV
jgi:uroporphyrinogen-III synthase